MVFREALLASYTRGQTRRSTNQVAEFALRRFFRTKSGFRTVACCSRGACAFPFQAARKRRERTSPDRPCPAFVRASPEMSLPLNMYQSIMASSFAARGVEKPVGVAAPAPTFTQQMTAQFMAPAKKEFSAQAFVTDLAIVRAPARRNFRTATASILFLLHVSTTERARRSRRRALARAPARVRAGARRVFFAHLVMRSPRIRVAPALTRALHPSGKRVFSGRHLRFHRQDCDRAHRARQAPHPDPGCQPQGAHPPPRLRTKRRTEKPRLPALSNRLRPSVEAFERAIARARRAALREAHARRESTRVVFSCPRLSVTLAPAAPAAAGGATRRSPPPRKDGGGAFPRRESGVFARATWRSRGRYLVGDLSGAKRSPEKGVFASVPKLWLTPLFSSFSGKNRSCPARSLGTLAS